MERGIRSAARGGRPRRRSAVHIICTVLLLGIHQAAGQLDEGDRVAEYRARGHTWPPLPSDYIPPTPGWQSTFERRFRQIEYLTDEGAKYNGFMSAVHSALIAPNFTEYGWGLTRAPQDLVDALASELQRGLAAEDTPEEQFEHPVDDEYPAEKPLMVNIGALANRAMEEMLPIHEAWSGVALKPNNAYGLRVYRNQSNLQMHVDESSTHVISSFYTHDPEGDPWPLVIEDLHGNTHEVLLETGDMLLYESSKCFHGRPKRYNGRWYSSLFTHYYPVEYWDEEKVNLDAHYWVPPDWHRVPEEEVKGLETLVVSETSFKEPECEHEWCALKGARTWERPEGLKFGQVFSGDGKIRPLGRKGEREEL
ncbi:LOW QUALITY PROTEIN: hypothetical protein ACHAXT_012917 [Thalassiosira profunda]